MIELTALRPDDSPTLFRWINDRELVILNGPYRPISQAEHDEWFTAIQQRADTRIFAIRRCNPGTLIGTCQLRAIDPTARRAELQIRIGDPDARGHGLGTEAVRRLVEYGFNELQLRRIELQVFASNERARRAYEKAGFTVVDRLKDDLLVMAIQNA